MRIWRCRTCGTVAPGLRCCRSTWPARTLYRYDPTLANKAPIPSCSWGCGLGAPRPSGSSVSFSATAPSEIFCIVCSVNGPSSKHPKTQEYMQAASVYPENKRDVVQGFRPIDIKQQGGTQQKPNRGQRQPLKRQREPDRGQRDRVDPVQCRPYRRSV